GVYTAVVKYQNFWASISFSIFEKEEKKTTPTPVMPPQILFDKESYSATDVGALIVNSISDDFDPNTIESVKAKLWSSTDPNGLFLVLRETGPNTGIFETDFSLVTNRPSSGNILRVSPGDNITAEYGGASSTLVIEEKIVGKSGFNFIIYDKPLPPATVGKYYRYSFCDPSPSSKLLCGGLIEQDINNPVGGVQPYTFQKETLLEIGGNIPFGLKLNPNGVLEGTPIKADTGKTFKFKVCAIDNTRSFVCEKTSLKVVESGAAGQIGEPPETQIIPGEKYESLRYHVLYEIAEELKMYGIGGGIAGNRCLMEWNVKLSIPFDVTVTGTRVSESEAEASWQGGWKVNGPYDRSQCPNPESGTFEGSTIANLQAWIGPNDPEYVQLRLGGDFSYGTEQGPPPPVGIGGYVLIRHAIDRSQGEKYNYEVKVPISGGELTRSDSWPQGIDGEEKYTMTVSVNLVSAQKATQESSLPSVEERPTTPPAPLA
ncbi:MAG: hypothetical protein ACREBU_18045, partial [Nitrososphaera sp.]